MQRDDEKWPKEKKFRRIFLWRFYVYISLFFKEMTLKNVISTFSILKSFFHDCSRNPIWKCILKSFSFNPPTTTSVDSKHVKRWRPKEGFLCSFLFLVNLYFPKERENSKDKFSFCIILRGYVFYVISFPSSVHIQRNSTENCLFALNVPNFI